LAHLSYIIGHKGEAAVIDPRTDVDAYLEIARDNACAITHIFETHRNEDYVIGSRPLAQRTGAEIHHGANLDFGYGNGAKEGDAFDIGGMRLKILETPGHTFESISIALYDTASGEEAVGVFTGDALFIGDVGRTDFFPDRAEEVAGLLYESIHDKLLPLGDQCLLWPAHGAGSVCGSAMAPREFSSLGYERKNNPRLQLGHDEFINFKVNEHHYQPPYFRKMEEYNQSGEGPVLRESARPQPVSAERFENAMSDGLQVLDTRSPEAFAGAFIPGSLSIPMTMIPSFAGWYLDYERPIGLVVEDAEQTEQAVRHLTRLGYHRIPYFLEGMTSWETTGRDYDRIPAVHADELVERIQGAEPFTLLDVRAKDEFESGRLPNAQHIYVGELSARVDEVPRDKPVTTFCGSGKRAIIAASILKRNGFEHVEDSLGSMAACKKVGCPIEQ
jgi:hydroxyacylglutathione hydrolase